MAERCYTDEELDRDALSVTVMDDGEKIRVLPDDHPAIVARNARYKAEAQARRDAMRIDANHHFAGDAGDAGLIPYLNGEPQPHATECYVGEQGWVEIMLPDKDGKVRLVAGEVPTRKLTGRVELRPKP
jgi:hypothetical protein